MELQNIPSMTKLLNSSEFSDFDINQEILKKIINNTLDSVRKTVNSKKNNNLTDEEYVASCEYWCYYGESRSIIGSVKYRW